jgi:hypothetical protein
LILGVRTARTRRELVSEPGRDWVAVWSERSRLGCFVLASADGRSRLALAADGKQPGETGRKGDDGGLGFFLSWRLTAGSHGNLQEHAALRVERTRRGAASVRGRAVHVREARQERLVLIAWVWACWCCREIKAGKQVTQLGFGCLVVHALAYVYMHTHIHV